MIEQRCLSKMSRIFSEKVGLYMTPNGSLIIEHFGWSNRGIYECLAYSDLLVFQSTAVKIVLNQTYRENLYYVSLIYGFATAGGFLLLTLLFKLIHFLLHK